MTKIECPENFPFSGRSRKWQGNYPSLPHKERPLLRGVGLQMESEKPWFNRKKYCS